MTIPSLPARGSADWYAYAQALDAAAREALSVGDAAGGVLAGTYPDPDFDTTVLDATVALLIRADSASRTAVGEVIPVPDTPDGIDPAEKGVANGVATLGADGKVPAVQLPSIALSDFLGDVASEAEMLALAGQRGDWTTRSDLGVDFILIADNPTLSGSWRQITSPGGVTSVAGRSGAVVLSASDIAATGTRTSSTYLRGDNTWGIPPGGNGVRIWSGGVWSARPTGYAAGYVSSYSDGTHGSTRDVAAPDPGGLDGDDWFGILS